MGTNSGRTGTYVLLTEAERKALWSNDGKKGPTKKGTISTWRKSELIKRLNEKLPELVKDIKIITESNELDIWRDIARYGNNLAELEEVLHADNGLFSMPVKELHTSQIIKTQRDGKTAYWLRGFRISNYGKHTPKIYQPGNILRGIKAKKNTKMILLEAYKYRVLPSDVKDSMTIDQIKDAIRKQKSKMKEKEPTYHSAVNNWERNPNPRRGRPNV